MGVAGEQGAESAGLEEHESDGAESEPKLVLKEVPMTEGGGGSLRFCKLGLADKATAAAAAAAPAAAYSALAFLLLNFRNNDVFLLRSSRLPFPRYLLIEDLFAILIA